MVSLIQRFRPHRPTHLHGVTFHQCEFIDDRQGVALHLGHTQTQRTSLKPSRTPEGSRRRPPAASVAVAEGRINRTDQLSIVAWNSWRQNTDDYVLLIREGKFTLTVDQSGARPLKQGSR